MGDLLWVFVSAAVVNNFTLTLFLGLCPFVGVTQKAETAIRLGAANTFVMAITATSVWALNTFVLGPAPYLRIISFIVVIASLVQIVEMLIKKASPTLFRELGIYLPLITTNCAILGACLLIDMSDVYRASLLKSAVFALIICTVSCLEGLRTQGGAEGVGRATTRAVVVCFLLVIAADALFTALFYFAGQ